MNRATTAIEQARIDVEKAVRSVEDRVRITFGVVEAFKLAAEASEQPGNRRAGLYHPDLYQALLLLLPPLDDALDESVGRLCATFDDALQQAKADEGGSKQFRDHGPTEARLRRQALVTRATNTPAVGATVAHAETGGAR